MPQAPRTKWLPASFLLAVLPALPAHAARNTEIRIDHADGHVRIIVDGDLKTSEGIPLANNPTVDVGKDSRVGVTITNPNELLFVYTVKKGTPSKTSDQVALEKFQELALIPLLGTLGAAATPESEASPCLELSGLKDLKEALPEIDAAKKASAQAIRQSLASPDKSREIASSWTPDEWKKTLSDADKALGDLASKLLTGDPAVPSECAGIVALARSDIPRAQETVTRLAKIQDLINDLGRSIFYPNFFTVNVAENQPIEIEITKSPFYPEGLTTERLLGKYTITVSPESRARIATLAPAAVYSFVRDPSFTAKASGTQFVIAKTENPYKELNIAAMLLVEPKAWDLGAVSLGFQLGASPQKDLGLFLGFSLRANDLFTFGAGVAFQQVTRLKEGLSVGQTIATQDLLKTEKEFKEGLYVHVTVTPRKKD